MSNIDKSLIQVAQIFHAFPSIMKSQRSMFKLTILSDANMRANGAALPGSEPCFLINPITDEL